MPDGSHHHTGRKRSEYWGRKGNTQARYSSDPKRLPATVLNNVPIGTERQKLNKIQIPLSLKATSSEKISS